MLVATTNEDWAGTVDRGLTSLVSNSILRWEYLPGSFLFVAYTHRTALIEAGLIRGITRLVVQFHLFRPENREARKAITDRLAETHEIAWAYPFVWEEWRLKS